MYIVRLRLPSENYLTVLPGSTLQVWGRWVGSARYVITLTSYFKIFVLIFIPLNKKWVRIFVLGDFVLQILKGIPSIHTDLFKQNYRPNTDLYFEKFLFSLLNYEKNKNYRPFVKKADFLTEKQTFWQKSRPFDRKADLLTEKQTFWQKSRPFDRKTDPLDTKADLLQTQKWQKVSIIDLVCKYRIF